MPTISKNVLVVDDDAVNRDVLCRRLEREGYTVVVADKGPAALDMMRVHRFDLVMLDLMMPEMDGSQVLSAIKEDEVLREQTTAIIMLSGVDNREAISECLQLGACDYLVKPFVMSLAKSRIERCLKANEFISEWPDMDEGLAGSRVLIVDDNDLNLDLLQRQVKKAGYEPVCANGGRQALEFLETAPYDLVLLDVMMPDIDGVEVLKKLKSLPDLKDLPVIMVSALDESETTTTCIDLGAEDYLTKPFDPIILCSRIGACLQAAKLESMSRD